MLRVNKIEPPGDDWLYVDTMARRLTLCRRLSSAVIGLLTVWCLGCSGYDPLLAALLGDDVPAMTCASEINGATDVSNATVGQSAIASAADSDRGTDCGCGSCHAPSPQLIALTQPVAPLPTLHRRVAEDAPTPSRTPLLPPPKAAS